jgi:hypothetical protein
MPRQHVFGAHVCLVVWLVRTGCRPVDSARISQQHQITPWDRLVETLHVR